MEKGLEDSTERANFISELSSSPKVETVNDYNSSIEVVFKSGRKYIVDSKGKIRDKNGISSLDIANSLDKEEFYGKYVTNYISPNDQGISAEEGKKWRIFLANENNIYLIASREININYAPSKTVSGSTVGFSQGDTENTIHFNEIVSQYSGSSDVISDAKLNRRDLSKYNKWINSHQDSGISGAKVAASMLDTNIWNVYSGNHAEYAIGGPTIEMFCDSYNQTHDEGIDYKYQKINQEDTDTNDYNNGYSLKKSSSNSWQFFSGSGSIKRNLDEPQTLKNLYILDDRDYWLSSPSCSTNYNVLCTTINNYTIGYTLYWAKTIGIRPVVCLSSDVQLEKDGENYKILEN